MKPSKIKLVPSGKEICAAEGTLLMDLLHEYGIEFPCGGRGRCGKCRVKILSGSVRDDQDHEDLLKGPELPSGWSLACRSRCTGDLVLEVGQFGIPILADETPFEFIPGEGFGIAMDIGTTTLVGQMADLASGQILAVEKDLNPQARFGSDLISRIESAMEGHRAEMMEQIRSTAGRMVQRLLEQGGERAGETALVGNTVMQHLFCGEDVTPLSVFPFQPHDLSARSFNSKDLGWNEAAGRVHFYPSIGSFVGSDILAGILATRIAEREGYTALIDLGTNGEIVVGNRERILCASTAAGPAFEGGRISCGMTATQGAISAVTRIHSEWRLNVIGNVEPKGICGSGLIDLVSLYVEHGYIGAYGEILSGGRSLPVSGKIVLTAKDIQEFLLAKAAIATGLEVLMDKLDIGYGEVDRIFLAGGFGSYINVSNVVRTGMVAFPEERVRPVGNSALMGAKMFLFTPMKKIREILSLTEHVHLESAPGFQDRFIGKMTLL